jgi:ankyrin repeat protein
MVSNQLAANTKTRISYLCSYFTIIHAELVWAAHTGDQDKVANLIETSKRGVDDADEDGSTPLIAAAWSNYPEILTLLLNKGAQVNTQNATVSMKLYDSCACQPEALCQ